MNLIHWNQYFTPNVPLKLCTLPRVSNYFYLNKPNGQLEVLIYPTHWQHVAQMIFPEALSSDDSLDNILSWLAGPSYSPCDATLFPVLSLWSSLLLYPLSLLILCSSMVLNGTSVKCWLPNFISSQYLTSLYSFSPSHYHNSWRQATPPSKLPQPPPY